MCRWSVYYLCELRMRRTKLPWVMEIMNVRVDRKNAGTDVRYKKV
jgi:hypothetical protein